MAYYGPEDQQQQEARPPSNLFQNVTQGGYGFNVHGGGAACDKFNAGGIKIIGTVSCKAYPQYSLAVQNGQVVMVDKSTHESDPRIVRFSYSHMSVLILFIWILFIDLSFTKYILYLRCIFLD